MNLLEHDCPVDGAIMIEPGVPCNWCGKVEPAVAGEPDGEVIAHVNGDGESIVDAILPVGTKLYTTPQPASEAEQEKPKNELQEAFDILLPKKDRPITPQEVEVLRCISRIEMCLEYCAEKYQWDSEHLEGAKDDFISLRRYIQQTSEGKGE